MISWYPLSMRKVCRLGNATRSRLAIMTVSLILAILCEVENQDKGLDGVVQMVDHGGMLMSAGREGVIVNVREDPGAPSKKIRGLQGPTRRKNRSLGLPLRQNLIYFLFRQARVELAQLTLQRRSQGKTRCGSNTEYTDLLAVSSQILVHIISHCDVCSSPCPPHLQIFTARSLFAEGARLFNAFKSYSRYCTVSQKLCSWMSGCSLMVKKTLKSWARPCFKTHRTWEIALPRSMLFLSLHALITCVYTRGQNMTTH